jgi:Helix-turn-helix domain
MFGMDRRSTGPRNPPGVTRALIKKLYDRGMTQSEIASELGLRKSTVAYHVRRFGVPIDRRFSRRYDWVEIQREVDSGSSMRDCMARFGFSRDAWGKAVKRGDLVPNEWVTPLEELLVAGRRRQRGHIKLRLLRAGLKENRCEQCGITEWRDKPLNMALHHVNGDGTDNRLENIKFLCPNCHAQTPNYGGRNGHRRRSGGPAATPREAKAA